MPFQATCPNCLKILEVPESLLGKQVRCASCQQIFLIGQPRGSSAGAESAPKSVRTNDAGPQIQRAPRPPVMLRPSEELPSRRPRRIRRNKIPVAVWIAAGCAVELPQGPWEKCGAQFRTEDTLKSFFFQWSNW